MEWAEYAKLIVEKGKKSGTPCSACFELTPFCNFYCNMCYIRLTPEQAKTQGKLLNTDQWIHIAKEAKKLGAFGLEITGGEAVTRPDFPILYEKFIKLGFIVSLRSNGYLLQGEVLDLLIRYKPRCIYITLYGASNETYRKVCGVSDGFTIVTRNIQKLKDSGIDIRLSSTLTKDNISDRQEMIDWAKNNGISISLYGGLVTPIRAAKRSINHLKVDYDLSILESDKEDIIREIKNKEKYLHPFWMCNEYKTRFCITWDGRMTLCNCFPLIWSDPLSQGVRDAFSSLYKELDNVKRPLECINCQYLDYCYFCPVRFLSETGGLDQVSPRFCKIAKQNYYRSIEKFDDKHEIEIKMDCLEEM